MGKVVRIEVVQICRMYIVDSCDLNVGIFNEFIGYHVLHDYGLHSGYLRRL